jgi:multicomponent Na+:H+ antiporter subunit A
MFALLLLHFVVGTVLVLAGDRLGRRGFVVAAVVCVATLGWLATELSGIVDGGAVTESVGWISELGADLDLRLDAFGAVMTLLVSGVGVAVFVYAVDYFAHLHVGEAKLAGLMLLFAGSMLGVVWADNLIALFIAWELTSILSYLLIGNAGTVDARAAALQAILITGSGGLCLLGGLVVIGESAGTYRISELATNPPSGTAVSVALVFVLVGAFTKSAQVPFGGWLPAAMVAPTPISAYLHSATMVKAGVYLVARLSPIFATVGVWRPLVLVVGSATMIVGGWRALRQFDLKLLLAYGTVSQLGFMMLVFGTGEYAIAEAGIVLLLAHAGFKAALFMVVGIVDHRHGTRDLRALPRSGPSAVTVTAVISAASMAGIPPLLGFLAKEKSLEGYLDDATFAGGPAVLVVIVVGSVLTFAYAGRFVLGMLGRLPADRQTLDRVGAHPVEHAAGHAPTWAASVPLVALTAFTVVAGLVPENITALVEAATVALQPGSTPSSLHLWNGFTPALALSALVLASGAVLVWQRSGVERAQSAVDDRSRRVPSADVCFLSMLRLVGAIATRVTSVVQSGSMPIYLFIVLGTATIVPAIPLVTELDTLPQWVEEPIQIPLVIVVLSAALGAAVVRQRIAAAVLLGTAGMAMAGIYEVRGAPDLALTQFSIEILGTVMFVLVLRFLPRRFVDLAPGVVRPLRLVLSLVVGACIFVFAIVSTNSRSQISEPSVSEEMIRVAKPEGDGRNVIDVILVDIRGFDTLGEITVLTVAALGVVTLATTDRRRRRRADDEEPLHGATSSSTPRCACCTRRSWCSRCTSSSPATTAPAVGSSAGSSPGRPCRCATSRAASTASDPHSRCRSGRSSGPACCSPRRPPSCRSSPANGSSITASSCSTPRCSAACTCRRRWRSTAACSSSSSAS